MGLIGSLVVLSAWYNRCPLRTWPDPVEQQVGVTQPIARDAFLATRLAASSYSFSTVWWWFPPRKPRSRTKNDDPGGLNGYTRNMISTIHSFRSLRAATIVLAERERSMNRLRVGGLDEGQVAAATGPLKSEPMWSSTSGCFTTSALLGPLPQNLWAAAEGAPVQHQAQFRTIKPDEGASLMIAQHGWFLHSVLLFAVLAGVRPSPIKAISSSRAAR